MVEARAGEAIWGYAERLIAAAVAEQGIVAGEFHHTKIQAHPDSTVREVCYLFELRRSIGGRS